MHSDDPVDPSPDAATIPLGLPDSVRRVWQRLVSTRTSVSLTRVDIRESRLFAPATIEVPPALVIVGRHGSGKSAFFTLLSAALGHTAGNNLRPYSWPTEGPYGMTGRATLTFEIDGEETSRTVDLGSDARERVAAWSDLGDRVPNPWHISSLIAFAEYQMTNQEFESIERRGIGTLLHQHSAADRRGLRRILGREYEDLATYHSDNLDYGEAPIMRGSERGRNVTNADMSHGELWAHYVLSYALRFTQVGPVLIDEPETLISSGTHRAFIDEIARLSVSRGNQLMVATHSPDIAARFSATNTLVMARSADGIRLERPSNAEVVLDYLGVPPTIRSIALVEDRFGAVVLTELASLLGWRWPRSCEIAAVGGHSKVRSFVSGLDASLQHLRCFGVLDGDQRSTLNKHTPIAALPGDLSPEEELIGVAHSRPDALARRVDRSPGEVLMGLDGCGSLDHQYVVGSLARALHLPDQVLVHALVRCWLDDDTIAAQARDLMRTIDQLARERP